MVGILHNRPDDPVGFLESCVEHIKLRGLKPDDIIWDTFFNLSTNKPSSNDKDVNYLSNDERGSSGFNTKSPKTNRDCVEVVPTAQSSLSEVNLDCVNFTKEQKTIGKRTNDHDMQNSEIGMVWSEKYADGFVLVVL